MLLPQTLTFTHDPLETRKPQETGLTLTLNEGVLLFGVKNVYKDETVGGKPILHQMFCPFCPVIGAG